MRGLLTALIRAMPTHECRFGGQEAPSAVRCGFILSLGHRIYTTGSACQSTMSGPIEAEVLGKRRSLNRLCGCIDSFVCSDRELDSSPGEINVNRGTRSH